MKKVHEAWNLAYSQISGPISPIPTKPTPVLEQKWVFWWRLWPKWHVSMVVQYTDATIKLKLAHKQGLWCLGHGSRQDLYSNPVNCHQANSRFGAKSSILVAIMAKTTCVYGCTLYGCHYKVKISSWARFVKLETWLTVRFIVQSCQFPPSQPPFWRKTDKFCCHSGPKHMCEWLQTAALPF